MDNVVVVDVIRTGLAKAHRGTFNLTRSDDLVAHCINALLERNPALDPAGARALQHLPGFFAAGLTAAGLAY